MAMADKIPTAGPKATPFNVRPPEHFTMHADNMWHAQSWHEAPREDPAWPEVYTYTDAMSYAPSDEVCFHSSTHAPVWSLEVVKDGLAPRTVHQAGDLSGAFHPAPAEAYKTGCDWPVAHRWRLPKDMPSGFYRVISACQRSNGTRFVQHHFFVVRPAGATPASFLLLLPTGTWTAYNDWGGANHYAGTAGPGHDRPSSILSLQRPWTRGIVWMPEGAPRICAPGRALPGEAPRYRHKEWAYANGFGQFSAAAGWAQYDRHFVRWAEAEGYAIDMITQTDLHYRPELLKGYRCVVVIGHDEYWSAEMRHAIDGFVEAGGKLARFGANFLWQIRLEDEGRRQVCYKYWAAAEDPVRDTDQRHLLTAAFEDRRVGWPGATTVGVNGLRGIYASWGGFAPDGARGFTVYRPEHWAFERAGLRYGDVLGGQAEIFAYEVDGLDYTFRDGLPYPTGADGAPPEVEILAMAPAVMAESEFAGEENHYYIGESDLRYRAEALEGVVTVETVRKHRYGSGMIVHMPKGRGEVFTAGSCEWVIGLSRRDAATEQITRNVLGRYTAGPKA
jgi:hypothetical protein